MENNTEIKALAELIEGYMRAILNAVDPIGSQPCQDSEEVSEPVAFILKSMDAIEHGLEEVEGHEELAQPVVAYDFETNTLLPPSSTSTTLDMSDFEPLWTVNKNTHASLYEAGLKMQLTAAQRDLEQMNKRFLEAEQKLEHALATIETYKDIVTAQNRESVDLTNALNEVRSLLKTVRASEQELREELDIAYAERGNIELKADSYAHAMKKATKLLLEAEELNGTKTI